MTNQIIIRGQCQETPANFFIDTGRPVSLVSKSFIERLDLTDKITESRTSLSSFTTNLIKTYGEIILKLEIQ